MGIWLAPTPEQTVAWVLPISDPARLPDAIDTLRALHLKGVLSTPVGGFSALRLLSMRRRYPWQRSPGGGALPQELVDTLRREHRLPAWTITGGVCGTRLQVLAGLTALRRATRGIGPLRIVSPALARACEATARVMSPISRAHAERIERLGRHCDALLEMLTGRMSDVDLMSCRWRVREVRRPDSPDPLDNDCGFFWIAPTAPARGHDVCRLIALIERRAGSHDLDAMVGWTMLSGRAVLVPTAVYFDRDDAAACRRAERCHADMLRDCLDAGFPPYRAGTADMPLLDPDADSFWQLVSQIKTALDPGSVLAPGRYAPWQAQPPVAIDGSLEEAAVT